MENVYEEKIKRYKAVLRTRIDFKRDEIDQKPLLPNDTYYLKESSNERVSYDDIAKEAVWIINNDLKSELQKYTFISIEKVQFQAVYEGSIEIIYSVVIGLLELVGGLKDFYDTVQLIREVGERHINKKMSDRFGRHFKVDTYVIVPEKNYLHLEEKLIDKQKVYIDGEKRDAFFYYLLVANIVLLVIVFVLVFDAVKMLYFG